MAQVSDLTLVSSALACIALVAAVLPVIGSMRQQQVRVPVRVQRRPTQRS